MDRLPTSGAGVSVRDAAEQFGPFDGRAWFNTAHQGPLPQGAVAEAQRAAALKAAPYRIADEEFSEIPERLRALLARLVGADANQIVLGNSTSMGFPRSPTASAGPTVTRYSPFTTTTPPPCCPGN